MTPWKSAGTAAPVTLACCPNGQRRQLWVVDPQSTRIMLVGIWKVGHNSLQTPIDVRTLAWEIK
ncbi:hypothetical protein Ancab_016304, partial [Ancistrocladus abbreviatus]